MKLYSFEHKKCGTSLVMATEEEGKSHKCTICKKPFIEGN